MPFLLLFLLVLPCLPDDWRPPPPWMGLPEEAWLYAGLTCWGFAVLMVAAGLLTFWLCQDVYKNPGRREIVGSRYGKVRFWHLLAQAGFFGMALYLLGWGYAVRSLSGEPARGAPPMFPGAELVLLAPFLAGLVVSWAFFYYVERSLHQPTSMARGSFWTRRTYLLFQIRNNLALVVAPLFLLMAEKSLRRLFPQWQEDARFQLVPLSLVLAVFFSLPWILRLVLGLKPLPAGPLRDRLAATARRMRFRCSNILLWNTHDNVANAMVAGILPLPRYVLLTDRLVNELAPAEVEAVFGHEIGHVKHRHMLYYLVFLLVSIWVVGGLWNFAQLDNQMAVVPFMVSLGAYIFVFFGFLSRRCERQADVFGCRTVSCALQDCPSHEIQTVLLAEGKGLCPTGIRTFIAALEKVALVNGINRTRPGWMQSWQHSTIARRVEFLQGVLADPAVEARFQRRVFLVKWALFLTLAVALILLGYFQGWEQMKPF